MAKTSLLVRILRFGGWWFLIAGLITFAVGLGFAAWTSAFLARSTSTTGKVVHLDEQIDSENNSVNYAAVFSFVAEDGKPYTIRSGVATNPPGFEEGQDVSVLYIKSNPANAKLNAFWQLWFATVLCCALGVFHILFGALLLYFTRKYVKKSSLSLNLQTTAQTQSD